jgi:hypothetical protein
MPDSPVKHFTEACNVFASSLGVHASALTDGHACPIGRITWRVLLAVPESGNLRLHLAPPVSSSRKPKRPRENSL